MTDKTEPAEGQREQTEADANPAAKPRTRFQAFLARFGPTLGGRLGVFYGALAHLFVLVALGIGLFYAWAWLAPHMVETYRTTQRGIAQGTADSLAPGRSGLIYVESPEVYTRQRLVNDRYLQDAWLNERLAEIDDDDAGWIDSAYVSELLAVAQFGAGTGNASSRDETSGTTSLPPDLLEHLDEVPFQTRFRLQSQARDNIRQLILENALDDRHDLSGNTIFGLKFDTSVLPADNTHLNPTVAMRMCPSEIDQLLRRGPADERMACNAASGGGASDAPPEDQPEREPEDLIAHFLRFAGPGYVSFAEDSRARDFLAGVDGNYENWRENVEQRLESFERTSGVTSCRAWRGESELLCEADNRTSSTVSAEARAEIRRRLSTFEGTDLALRHVMRLTDVEANIGEQIVNVIEDNAEALCGAAPQDLSHFGLYEEEENERRDLTVLDFLRNEQMHLQQRFEVAIPGDWGAYSRIGGRFMFPNGLRVRDEACPVEHALTLDEPSDVVFNIVHLPDADNLETHQRVVRSMARSGFQPLRCDNCGFLIFFDDADGTSPDLQRFSVATRERIGEVMGFAAPDDALSDTAREAAELAASAARSWRICSTGGESEGWPVNLLYLDPEGEVEQSWIEWGFTPNPENCIYGRQARFRTGAYEFFLRMTGVESYTYAAFPRGDVSGVVREVHSQTGLDLGTALSAAGARLGLTSGTSERSVDELPIVVNFASGQDQYRGSAQDASPGLFDFGWSIVKSGAKEPMMTSQLVLLSVPAYLDEITLEYWTGFLDPNRIPTDRDASDYDGGRSFNELTFEERVAILMDGEEPRTMTLRVPPDYAALDSIVIGPNEAFGPRILRPNASCIAHTVDGNIGAVIPGDRLWRSTVVTLGTERADRIEVMPDMRGIRATFQVPCVEVDLDTNTCNNEDRRAMADLLMKEVLQGGLMLRVWTSEGSDAVPAEPCR